MQENLPTRHNCMAKPDFFTSKTSHNQCGEEINSTNFSDSLPNLQKREDGNGDFQKPSEDHLSPEMKQKLARDLLRTLTILKAREKFRSAIS
uniref:Uncharacterized protein n=1 Tax=Acrobeloides nanus TaxID=290746 RepID=A0A914EE82_9BILA